jgi:hypothetical protein
VSEDPRKAKTLDEACRNPDGTYNGLKMMSWVSEAMTPGKGVPLQDVQKIWDDLLKKKGMKS